MALNFTSEPAAIDLGGREASVVLSTDPSRQGDQRVDALTLGPDEGVILRY